MASHSWQFWDDPTATLARLKTVLEPSGRLIFVVRRHISREVMDWIPNPITRAGNELEGLKTALDGAGFQLLVEETLKSGSRGIVAGHK